jgi:hypothetical protein
MTRSLKDCPTSLALAEMDSSSGEGFTSYLLYSVFVGVATTTLSSLKFDGEDSAVVSEIDSFMVFFSDLMVLSSSVLTLY